MSGECSRTVVCREQLQMWAGMSFAGRLSTRPETLDVSFTWFLGGSHPAQRAQDVAGSLRI
jgi:hypothetical protein